jgi:surface protein
MEKGKEYQCSSCNQGYKLMKDGSCKKIENSFTAIYNITSISKPTHIMKQKLGHIDMYPLDLSDIVAYINGIKINIVMCDYHYFCYTFKNLGLIEVKIILNKTLDTLEEIFYYMDNLIEVNFSETFDTSHVLTMDSMFYGCYSLRRVNLSSFNTTLVCEMLFMFRFCYELTSVDLSNFDTRNVLSFQDIFHDTKKLNYIDISSFYTLKAYTHLFNGVAPNGTLLINKNTYNGDIPTGWNIIYKE